MPGRRMFRPTGSMLHGSDAVAYGVAVLGAGVFLHCHYFWGNSQKLVEYSILGKMIGGTIFIVGIAWLIIRLMFFG